MVMDNGMLASLVVIKSSVEVGTVTDGNRYVDSCSAIVVVSAIVLTDADELWEMDSLLEVSGEPCADLVRWPA